jgi:uncharacterized protein
MALPRIGKAGDSSGFAVRYQPQSMIDQKLLEILCCPVSKTSLVPISKAQLSALNQALASAQVQNVDGQSLSGQVLEALITTDSKVIYRVEDGIPILLPEEGIGTTQLNDFPR